MGAMNEKNIRSIRGSQSIEEKYRERKLKKKNGKVKKYEK